MVQSLATMPPSTRSTVASPVSDQSAPDQSERIASIRSRVWKATLSSAARANSRGPLLRVRPNKRAAGIGVPMRGAEAGEGWNEI